MSEKLILVQPLRYYECPGCYAPALLEVWTVSEHGQKVDLGKCVECDMRLGFVTTWVEGGIYVIPFKLEKLEYPKEPDDA